MLNCNFCKTYCDCWSCKGQAEEQREWTHFLSGRDVGQRQAAVITSIPRMHRLENISQLQKIKTDNRGGQDGELQHREDQNKTSEKSLKTRRT